MKLWMILYASHQIGGTWGPLPYDMDECLIRAAERNADIQKVIETGFGNNGNPVPPDMIENLKTWKVVCEERDQQPQLGEEQPT